MKKLSYIPILFCGLLQAFLLSGCRAGNADAVNPREDDSLRRVFYDDGARLTVRSMHRAASEDVKIPRDSIDYYVDRLLSVYYYIQRNGRGDSLDQLMTIHAFENPSLHTIDVSVAPGTVWMSDWNNNAPAVNDVEANSLIKKYKLKLLKLITSSQNYIGTVGSDMPVNTYALANEFKKLHGVKSAETNARIGADADILAYHTQNGLKLSYMRGAGDCASGCLYKKYWDFLVDKKGKVSYHGSRGRLPKDSAASTGSY